MKMETGEVVVVLLALISVFTTASGQGVFCDPFTCAENAECSGGECVCKSGFVGAGRFICVPTDQCPCSAHGDPHIRQFDGGRIRTVLPCQYNMASFSTGNGCNVEVDLVTFRRPNQKYPLRSFIEKVMVEATRDNTAMQFTIESTGLMPTSPTGTTVSSVPDTIPGVDITVTSSTYDNFKRATLPECDNTVIAFDPNMFAAAVSTPRTGLTVPVTALCGNCNSNGEDDNGFLALGLNSNQSDLALSLRTLSQTQSTTDSAVCTTLRTGASACSSDAALADAVKCCGALYDSELGTCLLGQGVEKDALLSILKDCIDMYCAANRKNIAAVYVSVMTTSYPCSAPAGYICPQ